MLAVVKVGHETHADKGCAETMCSIFLCMHDFIKFFIDKLVSYYKGEGSREQIQDMRNKHKFLSCNLGLHQSDTRLEVEEGVAKMNEKKHWVHVTLSARISGLASRLNDSEFPTCARAR